jgi:hypothetical protein
VKRKAESGKPKVESGKPEAESGKRKAEGKMSPISAPLPPAPCPPPSALRFRLSAFGFLATVLLLSGCAGYRIGAESLYPCNVRTVYVPVFESDSFRRYLGERLTEAVIKEIELKTPYKVTGDSNADTILSGRITNESKRVLVLNKYHDPRDNEVSLKVKVRWLDRQSNLIRDGGTLPVPEELAAITETATAVPEVGQSVATAQQQAIQRLAEQIVGMMEAPW